MAQGFDPPVLNFYQQEIYPTGDFKTDLRELNRLHENYVYTTPDNIGFAPDDYETNLNNIEANIGYYNTILNQTRRDNLNQVFNDALQQYALPLTDLQTNALRRTLTERQSYYRNRLMDELDIQIYMLDYLHENAQKGSAAAGLFLNRKNNKHYNSKYVRRLF